MSARFASEIAEITLAWRDQGTAFASPPVASLLAQHRFHRVSRLTLAEGEDALPLGVGRLMAASHQAMQPFVLAVCRGLAGAEVWFGGSADLAAMVRGSLGQAVLETGQPTIGETLEWLRLSGAPTVPDRKARATIDCLCEQSGWIYLVRATPIPQVAALEQLSRVSATLTVVQDVSRKKQEVGHDELLQRFVELGTTLLGRLQQGLTTGLWSVEAWVGAERPRAAATLLAGGLAGKDSSPEPMRVSPCRAGAGDAGELWPLTSAQAALFVAVPGEDHPGFAVARQTRFGVQPASLASGPSIALGQIVAGPSATGNELRIPLDDLASHGLVAGITGSGKTNTCFNILAGLAEHDVPFLVIESAKSEYRELLADPRFARCGLRVFTIGDERIAPFRINPFEVDDPGRTLVQTHIDFLKELFAAAFVLYPPMPTVLEQSLEEIYRDRGWDLARNVNLRGPAADGGAFPTLDDLVAKVSDVIARMNYDAQLRMNITAGLVGRLDQLRGGGGKGPMLNTRRSIASADLFGHSCILELKALVSDDEKAFLIGLLLIRLHEYHEALGRPLPLPGRPRPLRHVTLIEEAHRLLRNVPTGPGSDVAANPKGRAVETFSNVLAEVRAYGEGIVLAEQIPVKLVPDAIKNTNLKLVHRLLAEDDRRVVGAALNLEDAQLAHLARLRRGEAVAYLESLETATQIRVPPAPAKDPARLLSEDALRRPMPAETSRLLEQLERADPVGYRRLDAAYQSVMTTFLEGEPALSRISFVICRRFQPACARLGQDDAVALFQALLGRWLEMRGAPAQWPYSAIESAARATVEAVAGELAAAAGGATCEAKRRAASQSLQRLFAMSRPPYAGCAHCPAPCRWRHDVGTLPVGPDLDQFAASGDWAGLAIGCDRICREAWPEATRRMTAGAAFCLALARLDASPVGDRAQAEAVSVLRELVQPITETAR